MMTTDLATGPYPHAGVPWPTPRSVATASSPGWSARGFVRASLVYFTRPRLLASLGELRVHNLEAAGATVDLLLVRHEHDVGVTVLRREGNIQIMVVT